MRTQFVIGMAVLALLAPRAARADTAGVSALGRLEPRDGLIRVAGPSGSTPVVARLEVKEGQRVEKGQLIAVLDDEALHQASLVRAEAELRNAESELGRNRALHSGAVISDARRGELELRVEVARADAAQARARLGRARVHAPIAGQIIEIHAREGERIGPRGVVELGATEEMFAIAEVFETDIGRVKLGQRARVRSPALGELAGVVEWIGLKVGRLEAIDADPAARTDARVVEVGVRLDPGEGPARLTNLQVEIEFEP